MRYFTGLWFLLATALLLVTPNGAQATLLTNGGFESSGGSLDGWFVDDPTTVGLSTAGDFNIIRNGVAAARITGKDLAGCGGPSFQNSLIKQTFPSVAGKEYVLSGWSYVPSAESPVGTPVCASNRAVAQIAFFYLGVKLSQNEILIAYDGFPTDQWVPFSLMLPAPALADSVEASIIFLKPGCDIGDAVYVDDLTFEEVTPAPPSAANLVLNPSFDDGFLNWTKFDNVFLVSSGGGFNGAESELVRTAERSAKLYSSFLSPPAEKPSGMFQTLPTTAGQGYRMEVWSMHTCADGDELTGTENYIVAQILFRDSGGNSIGAGERRILDASSPLGTWTRHVLYGWAPAGAVTVEPFILFFSPLNQGGSGKVDDIRLEEVDATAVPESRPSSMLRLHQNAPNPVRAAGTSITFDLLARETVELDVYDVSGRLVANLLSGNLDAGPHRVTWDGTTRSGARAAAGVYRYVLRTATDSVSRSLVIVD